MNKQLALNFSLADHATFNNFYIGNNAAAVASIKNMLQNNGANNLIYLWGSTAVGCSHLLQAACHKTTMAAYLPLKTLVKYNLNILQGLESNSIVCFDNIEAIAENKAWQQAIFHLFNKLRDNNSNILISGNNSPGNIAIELADLKSRLAWGITYKLAPLNDTDKIAALQLRAKMRGLALADHVGKYLITHIPRNMGQLFSSLDQLDQASMVAQRKLTIPFVREVLGL